MFELMLAILRDKLDTNNRVNILRSSKDSDLAKYFDFFGALGSTHMAEDGLIYVKIHDVGGATRGTWFEEFGHALQYLKYGNVELSVDSEERCRREIEVANCLIKNATRLRLSKNDVTHCQAAIQVYGGTTYGS